jgi:hypothetical protein
MRSRVATPPHAEGNRFPLCGSSPNPAPTLRSTLHSDGIVLRCALPRGRPARNDTSGRSTPCSDRFPGSGSHSTP